ncbi:MAG: hypothetical protein D6737_13320 [Chloroflexi bacterium]|nr:MAG: hypothetical protein D6737_13320 [Chloroflexota bacterium]
MDPILYHGGYIVEISEAILEDQVGLNVQQVSMVETIRQHATEFVYVFWENQSLSVVDLYDYVRQEASTPLIVIQHYCDKLLSGKIGKLHETYVEGIQLISQSAQQIRTELQHFEEDLYDFIQRMGFET